MSGQINEVIVGVRDVLSLLRLPSLDAAALLAIAVSTTSDAGQLACFPVVSNEASGQHPSAGSVPFHVLTRRSPKNLI